jgi:hypothetical protein
MVLAALVRSSSFAVEVAQRMAWEETIALLRRALRGVADDGWLWLEYEVPRLGSRIDAVVVARGVVVPIECKVGADAFLAGDVEQVWDYALDLKNFHRGSHTAPIRPLLCATLAPAGSGDRTWAAAASDGVHPPRRVGAADLPAALQDAFAEPGASGIDGEAWGRQPYQPTPTIVQAARALFARHSVAEIARSDAGAQNLAVTARTVEQVLVDAQRESWKAIVLVTGVPGAGKTLVGLDVATRHRRSLAEDPAHAVFLSGNGPLIAVLQEALVRDERDRLRAAGRRERKGSIQQRVKPFLQNVHHFRDAGLRTRASGEPPADHVVVFDEAQRAWNHAKTARFLKQKKGIDGFTQSEPEFQLAYMDRRPDWAVVVCLVGGGQEIHDGEAGIQAWIDAVRTVVPHWRVFLSPRLTDREYGAGEALVVLRDHANVTWSDDLHLAVSMRSFRAEHLSTFVKAVLDLDVELARSVHRALRTRYPLVVTRDLQRGKRWVREHARGSERYGLVASSQAERLKPHAIDVRTTVDPVHWFLGTREDTRSSWYLEDAATEFQVQGLELDWVVATWDADLRWSQGQWLHRKFKGSKWQQVHDAAHRRHLVNSYRVLLTRARQGMAIFVPPGDADDPTRLPEYYDGTFAWLCSLGIEAI